MQRLRAAKVLRAIHRLEAHKEERADGRESTESARLEDVVGALPGADGAAVPKLERLGSKEWAESLLRWDGSPNIGVASTDGIVADYDIGRSAQSMDASPPSERLLSPKPSHKAAEPAGGLVGSLSSDFESAKEMILGNWVNVLLAALPFAFISHYLEWSPNLVFLFSLLAIVPLALILGEITEDLALRFGDIWGGLINATFGNVVEMILSIILLQKGLNDGVSSSLIGSVLSNLLLVIGCCFFVGGINFKEQKFSSGASKANTSLLLMSCIAMLLPSMIAYSRNDGRDEEKEVVAISRAIAVVLTAMYCCYLYFQLFTHKHIFSATYDIAIPKEDYDELMHSTHSGRHSGEEEEEGEEEPNYSLAGALILMTLTTGIVALTSEFLSDAIESVSKASGLSLSFIGIIILPIAGNACEHITAVLVAAKDKMDLAIAVGVGSSIQIAIFVFPFVVIVGWVMDIDFTMKINQFDMMVILSSVVLSALITIDGQSNWFTGLMLMATYVLIGVAYLF